MGFFTRRRKQPADTDALGVALIALRLDQGDVAPAGSTVVVFDAAGQARRAASGKVACGQGESVFCFHPGPYTVDLIPFAAAPEWGLRLRFVVDAANPRVSQQRFDLYLYSETSGRLQLAGFGASVEAALQAELAQGALDLPPCTSLDEWHAFRAGLNQLMYTRYGVTVDDCVPVDLGEQVDFADMLKVRAMRAAEVERLAADPPAPAIDAPAPVESHVLGEVASGPRPTPAAAPSPRSPPVAQADAQALRRLFLELPAVSRELRLLRLPEGLPVFERHQALLLRLGMASLNVTTMPALAWAAPDRPLAEEDQHRRSRHTLIARDALDEAWSLLARLQLAGREEWPQLLDETDRICANLETGLSLRRAPHADRVEPSL
ncbi:hypothetical protein SAMN05428959_104532 [Duganella sp. CF517]|uniref:hypothetical protein n=1 Tax=Duganella sp. CF517 TaxID=1881038 RepID=UPI0008C765B8|nr:hypothetical protein [Duganella sp. CF517]SEO07695.1 hypothetical protein SAMN05428959_104532 [Duganella sp. CF517]